MTTDTVERLPHAPRVSLEVTQGAIKDACKKDSAHCMIAESIAEAFPDARRISVDLQTIRFTDRVKKLRYTYLTPRTAQVALVKFDQGMKMDPFAVQLRQGQVTTAGRYNLTDEGKAQLAKNAAGARKAKLAKATLRYDEGEKDVPARIGGKTPPVVPGGRRRAFGLRGLAL